MKVRFRAFQLLPLLLGGALFVTALVLWSTTRSPGPETNRSGAVKSSTVTTSIVAERSTGLTVRQGLILEYAVNGDIDVRCALGAGESRVQLQVSIHEIQAVFSLKVLDRSTGSILVSISPHTFQGSLRFHGADGKDEVQHVNMTDLGRRSAEYADTVLLLLSQRGVVESVFIDSRCETASWIREGYQDYVENALSFVSLFPSLGPGASDHERYVEEVRLFGLVGMEYEFSSKRGEIKNRTFEGRPLRVLSFLGMGLGNSGELPMRGPSPGGLSASVDEQLGYFTSVSHKLNLGSAESFVRINISVRLTQSDHATPEPLDPLRLKRMKRFSSLDELGTALQDLKRRATQLRQAGPDGPSDLAGILTTLESHFTAEGEPDEIELRLLRQRIAKILASYPEALQDIESMLTSFALKEQTLFQLLKILSSLEVRNVSGADALSVSIARRLVSESALFNAMTCLQEFASDGVIDFLTSYSPQSTVVDQSRNLALWTILTKLLKADDVSRARRVLEFFSERIRTEAATVSLLNPFKIESRVVEAFIREQWESGADKRASLKLMMARCYREGGTDGGFREVFEKNVFGLNSDSQVINELIPLAAADKNKDLLRFFALQAPSSSVRLAAELQLKLLELHVSSPANK